MIDRVRVLNPIAVFQDRAGRNLEHLERSWPRYFEEGAGRTLPQEEQAYVKTFARRATFWWSARGLFFPQKYIKSKEGKDQSFCREVDRAGQVLGVDTGLSTVAKELSRLDLTRNQEAGLERRAVALARKVIGLGHRELIDFGLVI